MDLSPDGKWFIYGRHWEGKCHIWALPSAGGEPRRLLMDPMNQYMCKWSPDGHYVAFHSEEPDNRNLWVVKFEDGSSRQLTQQEAWDVGPNWSPDGKEIAFYSARSGNMDIWVIPNQGGEAQQITTHPSMDYLPGWSQDGQWINFLSARNGEWQYWRVPRTGGDPELLSNDEYPTGIKSLDGQKIYYHKGHNIWVKSINTGVDVQLTNLTGKYGGIESIRAIDDKYIYFIWQEDISDIWVMDVEWE